MEAIILLDKRETILISGKELFSSKGFKDTNVAEIAKKAGMATGTFYNYYTSKEKLFMDIYLEENEKLKRNIMETLNLEASPMEIMSEMMKRNLEGMMENPILKEWYNKDVFNKIEKSFRESNGLEHVDFLYDNFIEIVKKWQLDGQIRSDIEPEMIMAIFSALVSVELHKDEIGVNYFPKVIEYMAEFIMKGLM